MRSSGAFLQVLDSYLHQRKEAIAACNHSEQKCKCVDGGLSQMVKRRKVLHSKQMVGKTPFERMQECRDALKKLDNCGWNRSYHQRLFHEDFLVRV